MIVVGAGPAGTTCAKKLAEAGWNALILEKTSFPRRKLCAGWITPEALERVDRLEQFLRAEGFAICRARVHGDLLRIEVEPAFVSRLASDPLRERLSALAKAEGFRYATLDLDGFRSGSMNEALSSKQE